MAAPNRRIANLKAEILKSVIGTVELSNQLLRPLQQLKQEVDAFLNALKGGLEDAIKANKRFRLR